jgi:Integrase zinc binding domain/Integrase core domain/RNase H-like domain found in reverse transcriptase
VKWAVERFQDYVFLGKVEVYTDHESLQWMTSTSKGKILRWLLFLRQFDLEIHHISGETNVMADWLSRAWDDDPEEDAIIDQIAVPVFTAVNKPDDQEGGNERQRVFAPEVPKVADILEALQQDKPLDYIGSFEGPDGLRYSQRNSKLYIPKSLRESILWWFHTSKYGGHAGVNRTRRRLAKYVWWPGMAKEVQEYVGGCIYCIRRQPTRPKTLKGALTKALPFQLVSLDYVGPRQLGARTWYLLVAVDHATRFMVADVTDGPTADHAIRLLRRDWRRLGTPLAVLTDRGAAFRDKKFHDYVVQELCAYHVYTSPYYPQGNAINEASHKALEYSLSAALRETNNLEEAVEDAVLVHNATPNAFTGQSPYYAIYGNEFIFPGWQRLAPTESTLRSQYVRNELRLQGMVYERLIKEQRQLENEAAGIEVGSWVVYPLGEHELKYAPHPSVLNDKYHAAWSLPAKVRQVNQTTLVVQTLGCPERTRDVPRAACRKLKYDVPASLVPLALKHIEFEAPRYPKSLVVQREGSKALPQSWDSLVRDRQGIEEEVGIKRARLSQRDDADSGEKPSTSAPNECGKRLGGE